VESPFKSRPSKSHALADGRVIYESRSVAVTALVLAYDAAERSHHVVVGERGTAVDLSGLHCLVCGYLDWDESLADAVRREVFEEAGIDLAALERAGRATVPSQPIYVESSPGAHRQNVTARFIVELDARVPLSTVNAEPNEVGEIRWLPVTRAAVGELRWAFHHDAILNDLADFYASERESGQLDEGSTRRLASRILAR
jgi:8-oxo-dGTP pyrophosphatase MutT (NUDIX family)